ncbi:MAG: DMSO reductase [Thermodesulfobacteriota bacterium]|nr:DMSO reductase [Thermodesulfobacteriota bacterium]
MDTGRFSFKWMVEDTAQGSWIEGKGIFLWLAFFFTEIGAGSYFVSLFMNFRAGWMVGWLTALVLGGIFHVLYLGKPARGWRIFNGLMSSELSRGLLVICIFAVIGLIQILPAMISGLAWDGYEPILKATMGIVCVLLITHGFLTMGVVKAAPMWNSPLMIPLSLISGIWVGSQVVEVLLAWLGLDMGMAEKWVRWSLLCFIGVLVLFLWWDGVHSSETAASSIKRIINGDLSMKFYLLVVTIGIVVPLIITILIWNSDINNVNGSILLLRAICVMIGDVMMRYCIMRAPLYTRLI